MAIFSEHEILKYSLWLKGTFALIETAGGALFYLINKNSILDFVYWITRNELLEDPRDLIASYLISSAGNLMPSTQHFIAIYLFTLGFIKIVLVISLLLKKYWVYPASIVIFILFALYQLYRYSFTHSFWLLVITVIDMIVIALIWREYKHLNYK